MRDSLRELRIYSRKSKDQRTWILSSYNRKTTRNMR